MDLTPKESLAWKLYAAGSLAVVVGTAMLNGQWHAMIAFGTSLITAAAGLGLTGLRPNSTGGRT